MDLTQLLPEDVLANVLRLVDPHGLAACRCASKALRAVIDARRLLFVPPVDGIFIKFDSDSTWLSEFFARPSTTGPAISGRFDYLPPPVGTPHPRDWRKVKDHCNGLLLLGDGKDYHMVNPATRQWDRLPPPPPKPGGFKWQVHLVFHPIASPHYHVFLIKRAKYMDDDVFEFDEESDWPPSVYTMHVFSSRSGCWEERFFIREGEAVGTAADMLGHWDFDDKRYGVYYRGAFYVHWKTAFIMRISLSNDKYQVIKVPMEPGKLEEFYLGRSEKGVYLATTCTPFRLMVWFLDESCGHTNWVLKHNERLPTIPDYYRPILGPWVLQDINFNESLKFYKERNEVNNKMEYLIQKKLELNPDKKELVEGKFEHDSENDNTLHRKYMVDGRDCGYLGILGFHPYKEIIFLNVSLYRGLAYHLEDSKVEDLGYLYPTSCYESLRHECFITESYPYMACLTGHQKATWK